MSKTIDIDYAIKKTIQVHPDFKEELTNLVNAQCQHINVLNFTSQYGARKKIVECTPDDFIIFICEKLVDLYNVGISFFNTLSGEYKEQLFNQKFGNTYYWNAKKILDIISNPDVNAILYFKSNPHALLEACSLVVKARYLDERIITQNMDLATYMDVNSYKNYTLNNYCTTKGLIEKIQRDAERQKGVTNVAVRKTTVNKCLDDIVNGSQLSRAHNEYTLDGTLFATQDRGKRPNQEDSVLIMTHPSNPEFKLMVVSDGMGGVELGEYASSETVKQISEWFNKLDPTFYYYPADLQKAFNQQIENISNNIYHVKNRERLVSGATFVGALITDDKTIVSSVGDSRAYTLKGKKLDLLTSDESLVWRLKYRDGQRRPSDQELDDDRFLINNNVITKTVGDIDIGPIQSHMIPNKSYDKLILLSDGVTDLLTQDRIKVISSMNDLNSITKYLVLTAVQEDAIRAYHDPEHRDRVNAGKDNATAAMYARR